jgi:hypothetical protein
LATAAALAGCSRHHASCIEAEGTVLSLDLPTTAEARTVLTDSTPFETRTCVDGIVGLGVEIPDLSMYFGPGTPDGCRFSHVFWQDDRLGAAEQCELAAEHCAIDDSGAATRFSYVAPPADTGDTEGWCSDMSLEIEFAVIP